MAKTDSERTELWRRRTITRASYFDDLDAERRKRLHFEPDDRPEAKALRHYFLNYPRCKTAPVSLEHGPGGWCIELDYYAHTAHEAAAAVLALQSVTSLNVWADAFGDGKGGAHWSDEIYETVKREIARLRELGLWGE